MPRPSYPSGGEHPLLHTPPEEYSSAERAKLAMPGLAQAVHDPTNSGDLGQAFSNLGREDIPEVAETLAKSYGIYLQFNRAKSGEPKDWRYMLRVTIPGGGPLRKGQWRILNQLAERYTLSESYTGKPEPNLRATTRQNLQFHWVRKEDLLEIVREIATSSFYTLNGCGDNVRNVVACPLSTSIGIYDANGWAQRVGRYFQLPLSPYLEIFEVDPTHTREVDEGEPRARFSYAPNLLNRKFKIGFSSVLRDPETGALSRDNCVEVRTDDVGVVPVLHEGELSAFQIFVGGGQGERNGHASASVLGEPLGTLAPQDLLRGLDAIVAVQQEWGDRKNRHWARLKYVIRAQGIDWFRERVREVSGNLWGAPVPELDPGPRELHQGWTRLQTPDTWAFGLYLENGRVVDGPNGRLRSLITHLMERYDPLLSITPNQDLLFQGIREEQKTDFMADLRTFGYGERAGRPYSPLRLLSGACVGRDTCRLAYTDSEKFEPELLDALEPRWGNLRESIGVTGCERQCFRPATKTIGWVGSGLNQYQLRLGGTEDGRHQGQPLFDPLTDEPLFHRVPRASVAGVTSALLGLYERFRSSEEAQPGGAGYFFRRVGTEFLVEHLVADPEIARCSGRSERNSPFLSTVAAQREFLSRARA